jgi:signal transduction histidine kinase
VAPDTDSAAAEVLRGIRARITAVATVAMVTVLVMTAFALVATQRRLLTDNLDEALAAQADELVRATSGPNSSNPLPPRGDDDQIAQVVGNDGRVISASANYSSQPPLPPPPGGVAQHVRTTALLLGEPDYRLLSRRSGQEVVHVASPIDDIDEGIAALRIGLTGAIPIVAAIFAVLIWWLVGRTLRPVEAIRREVADITGRSLHRRVTEPAPDDEIRRLAHTMNAMLDRVERSTESTRRFVADASHELRSPLTRMRSELEVDLAHPETADLRSTHRSVLEETKQMQRLVEDLLVLARHDDDATRSPRHAVDLDDIVLHEVRRAGARDGVDVECAAVSGAQVVGDAGQLSRVVRILLENAVRHARTSVSVALAEQGGTAVLSVTDDGPGIAPEHQQLVFERFRRIDDARTRADGGAGLGLAIARSIAEGHGGTLSIDAGHQPGARFIVEIPTAGLGTDPTHVVP